MWPIILYIQLYFLGVGLLVQEDRTVRIGAAPSSILWGALEQKGNNYLWDTCITAYLSGGITKSF